jgi:parvulin-like peptidyl-prolyl isomerase
VRPAAWALLGLLALGCRPAGQADALALVNGEAVSRAQLEEERAFLMPLPPDDEDLLEDLIDQALILQVARREGLRLNEQARLDAEARARAGTDLDALKASLGSRGLDYHRWARRIHRAALIEEVVRQQVRLRINVSPQEVQDRYWEQLPRFRSPDRRVLRQIYTRSRSSADKALRELELGEPFAEVARRRGEGPEAAEGGALGAWALRSLPKDLAQGAASLKPGGHSKPLQSPWGWHILHLEARLPGGSDSLEQAAPVVRARLLREKEQPEYRAWLARLRQQAAIERRPWLEPEPTPKGSPSP